MTYDEILEHYERHDAAIPYVYIRRGKGLKPRLGPNAKLLVTFATHNNGSRYAALATMYGKTDYDVLAFRDPTNRFYLGENLGADIGRIIARRTRPYDPANVVAFGSSMAGYAALRWGLRHGFNCVVNNPQLDLDGSLPHAWPELANNIRKIPSRDRVVDHVATDAESAIVCLHGRHPMDLFNMTALLDIYMAQPRLSLMVEHYKDAAHNYMIRDFPHFDQLIRMALDMRRLKASAD